MMRGHNPAMFMQHGGAGGPRQMGQSAGFGPQRPPNVQVGPEGMPMGSSQEWRQLIMQQQQSMNFTGNTSGGGMRPGFNQGGHQGN